MEKNEDGSKLLLLLLLGRRWKNFLFSSSSLFFLFLIGRCVTSSATRIYSRMNDDLTLRKYKQLYNETNEVKYIKFRMLRCKVSTATNDELIL